MHYTRTPRAGFTLVEITVASFLLTVVMLAIFSSLSRDTDLARSTLGISAAETKVQQMLHALETELADARGANPRALLTSTLAASDTGQIRVDSTQGFPDRGTLLLDRGTGSVERLSYTGINAAGTKFLGLTRGTQCTDAATHVEGAEILWGGLAEPIAIQTSPPAYLYDGRSHEGPNTVYFRGDGTGFSYRLPTDPMGGTNYLDGDDLQWGSTVNGTPLLDGWSALYFVPVSVYTEAECQHDINHDGDMSDAFDVGQIRRRAWSMGNPTDPGRELTLGPAVVIQERCNWGGDLDHDGFDDPIFLWDTATRRLHVRLFVLGTTSKTVPITRVVDSTIFLRNEAAD